MSIGTELFSDDPFGGKGAIGFIPDYVGDYLNDRYPEVEATCRINNTDNVSLASPASDYLPCHGPSSKSG